MGLIKTTPWKIISFDLMSILLIVVSLSPLPCLYAEIGTQKEVCSYTLEVTTHCGILDSIVDRGTKDHVRVRFMDRNRKNVTNHHLKEPFSVRNTDKSKPFSNCATAKFNVSGPCLEGELCSLQFKVEGHDSWKLKQANVQGERISSFECNFHKKLGLPSNAWWGYSFCKFDKQRASSPLMYIMCKTKNKNGSKQQVKNTNSSPKRTKGRSQWKKPNGGVKV